MLQAGRISAQALIVSVVLLPVFSSFAQPNLRVLRESADPSRAVVRVRAGERSAYPVPAYITGKFAEHLYYNIVNGMDSQILRNPTFADFPLSTGNTTPDGVVTFQIDEQVITRNLRNLATSHGWPSAELDEMIAARSDGLAALWTRVGSRSDVKVSPDAGPFVGRAQRVQVASAGQGIAQWTYLPLHRVRKFQFEILSRAPAPMNLAVSLTAPGEEKPCAIASAQPLTVGWRKYSGLLEIPADLASDKAYKLTITADIAGQFLIRHALLRPADHVNGADPDIIRLLKESRLPLLRWPGGNFVSGYHWEDGVGPVERRPSLPNFAWGEIEPNLFGTDEFVAFCRAVGCEPMICVNAGSGTPEEAARWIEYCNGPATSPMGALRAANGHPEPYGIKHWEVGNELWGRWQYFWTSAEGYVDRYRQFSKAMLRVDPGIQLQSCGAPVFWGKKWNDTVISGSAPENQTITDHPLIGGDVSRSVDPLDVFRDFMAVPEVLQDKWSSLQQDMLAAGIKDPKLAVTELQLFAHLARASDTDAQPRLTRDNLVAPPTLAEGLYDVSIYHAALRLAPFVSMVTQSAVVNHGGGLRKIHERVFAHPCHYAQSGFAAFAGATPVVTEIEAAMESAPRVLPQLRDATPGVRFSAIDAYSAVATDGALLVSIVQRRTSTIRMRLELEGFQPGATAELVTLGADVPWAVNTLESPGAVRPATSQVTVTSGKVEFELNPFTVARLKIPRSR